MAFRHACTHLVLYLYIYVYHILYIYATTIMLDTPK